MQQLLNYDEYSILENFLLLIEEDNTDDEKVSKGKIKKFFKRHWKKIVIILASIGITTLVLALILKNNKKNKPIQQSSVSYSTATQTTSYENKPNAKTVTQSHLSIPNKEITTVANNQPSPKKIADAQQNLKKIIDSDPELSQKEKVYISDLFKTITQQSSNTNFEKSKSVINKEMQTDKLIDDFANNTEKLKQQADKMFGR